MQNNNPDEFITIARELGEDAKYFDAIPPEYTEYALTIVDKIKQLITNAKYNAKYMLSMEKETDIDNYVRHSLNHAIIQSEKAKEYNRNKS